MKAASLGKIITFYSYKGGTGRSMALANVAWILASNGKRVLVLDWDLEAPGLHTYFYPFLVDKELTDTDGLIDFVIDFAVEAMTPPEIGAQVPEDWYRPHANILRFAAALQWNFGNGGILDFVPAGRQGPSYTTRVNSFNWEDLYNRLGGGVFLEAAKEKMREAYDYILIDSRTGVSDTSGICTVQMPDILVVCFTLNNQSIEGAAAVTNSVYEQRRESGLQIFPVPMRIENAEKEKLDLQWEYAKRRFASFPAHMLSGQREQYWNAVAVPYVPYYAYEETLAVFVERHRRTDSLLASMEKLTAYLIQGSVERVHTAESMRKEILAQYQSAGESREGLERVGRSLKENETAVGPSTVEVPDLTGQEFPRARGELANAGLELGGNDEAPSETVAKDGIIGQSPAAGTKTEQGSLVSVTVSSGPEKKAPRRAIVAVSLAAALIAALIGLIIGLIVWSSGDDTLPVPDLVGQTENAANLSAGDDFKVEVSSREANDGQKDTIVSQNPKPGERAPQGSTIAVGVSAGQPEEETAATNSETADFTLTGTLYGGSSAVYSVAFSPPDGRLLASGSYDGTIKLWEDPRSGGEPLQILTGHSGGVKSVAFSPDRRLLASGGDDDTVNLWEDPQSGGEPLQILTGHSGDINSVAFSPDGRFLASGSDDDTIKLWNPQSGELLRTLPGHSDNVHSVALSPDGRLLASGSVDNTVKLWNPQSGELLQTLARRSDTGDSDTVFSVAFSPDGRLLASGSNDRTVKIWEEAEDRQ